MAKEYNAKLTDKNGVEWLFEGNVKGHPMWTFKEVAMKRKKKFTKSEALKVAMFYSMPGDVPGAELVN